MRYMYLQNPHTRNLVYLPSFPEPCAAPALGSSDRSAFRTSFTLSSACAPLVFPKRSAFGYALDRLVTVSSMCYHTSTSALSTSSSSRGLTTFVGISHLRGASRLDAFSVYPFPAWLLCHDLGKSTDTPAASPSRSSRTKDSSSQISYAHAG